LQSIFLAQNKDVPKASTFTFLAWNGLVLVASTGDGTLL